MLLRPGCPVADYSPAGQERGRTIPLAALGLHLPRRLASTPSRLSPLKVVLHSLEFFGGVPLPIRDLARDSKRARYHLVGLPGNFSPSDWGCIRSGQPVPGYRFCRCPRQGPALLSWWPHPRWPSGRRRPPSSSLPVRVIELDQVPPALGRPSCHGRIAANSDRRCLPSTRFLHRSATLPHDTDLHSQVPRRSRRPGPRVSPRSQGELPARKVPKHAKSHDVHE